MQGLLIKRKRLLVEREGLVGELLSAGEDADKGIRRAVWADGDDLVEGVEEILASLGFKVQDMDAELKEEAKREDLRLTLDDHPGGKRSLRSRATKRALGPKMPDRLMNTVSATPPKKVQILI